LRNIKFTGESASADESAAIDYVKKFEKIIIEGNYSSKQVFNVDETALYWKKMPGRTFVTEQEHVAPGYKASKDRLTLLVGGNANGDCKLKPLLLYRSETPRALKNQKKSELPVVWYSNKKAWMTRKIFKDWFSNYFSPFISKYNREQNLDNKALLILDNAASHSIDLSDVSPNIEVIFLPPNTTSILQPMDQEIIATFKAYYLRESIKGLVTASTGGKESVVSFWKQYSIKHAIDNIDCAWHSVSISVMNRGWKKLWPGCINTNESKEQTLSQCHVELVELSHVAGLKDLSIIEINDVLHTNDQELSNAELLQLYPDCVPLEYAETANRKLDVSNPGISAVPNKSDFDPSFDLLSAKTNLEHLVEQIESDSVRLQSFKMVLDGLMKPYLSKKTPPEPRD